ncbi:hypothetical protein J7E88_28610 [Streptomyces sp. ISL-10]|uniref:cytochrome P450 n=1 Tax=Streptomyces sp. ISL-10 TaxID=2819172 RepID=UPI001BE5294F|nr:cytochrome P450 [Streptomyces sp. ISL-10]MBT2369171.1 hypothetical protein [Streptomyces sp. ISL-10]
MSSPDSFVSKALGELGPFTSLYVLDVADGVIDDFVPAGREDLVLGFARPLPLLVMHGMLGMDERYAPGIGQAVPALLGESRGPERAEKNLVRLVRRLVVEKQATPGPDLVSWMLHYAPSGQHSEVERQVRLLLLQVIAEATRRIGWVLHDRLPGPRGTHTATDRRGLPVTGNVLVRDGQALARLIADSAVERLLFRLPGMRLSIPATGIRLAPWGGADCFPESLPAAFPPVRIHCTGDEEIRWLPEPVFTTAPPRSR